MSDLGTDTIQLTDVRTKLLNEERPYPQTGESVEQYSRNTGPVEQYPRTGRPVDRFSRVVSPVEQYPRVVRPVDQYQRTARPGDQYQRTTRPGDQYHRIASPVDVYQRTIDPDELSFDDDDHRRYDERRPIISTNKRHSSSSGNKKRRQAKLELRRKQGHSGTFKSGNQLTGEEFLRTFDSEGSDEILSKLYSMLQHNPDSINAVIDDEGNTFLHKAVKANNKLLVSEILNVKNVNIDVKNNEEKTALEVAIKDRDPKFDEVAAEIVKKMPNSRVRETFKPGHGISFQWLVECGFERTAGEILNSLIDRPDPDDGTGKVFFDVLDKDTVGRTPNEEGYGKGGSYSIYQWIALENKIDLVNHDVIRLLTKQKWTRFARVAFGFESSLYLFSVICLTFAAVTSASSDDVKVYDSPLHHARLVFEIISIAFVLTKLCTELVQLNRSRLKYFRDFFNILELSSCVLLIIVVPLRFLAVDIHWYFFAIGYGVWLCIIFKLAVISRSSGVHAQILWEILKKDVLQFSVLFIVVNMAFTGCFLLMLRADNDLLNKEDTSSFFRIVYVGLRTLVEAGPVVEYTGNDAYGVMSTIVLLGFLFLTVVILLNILIAQVNNTYQSIQDHADRHYELRLATLIAWMEINGNICSCLKKWKGGKYKDSDLFLKMDEALNIQPTAFEETLKSASDNILRKQATNEAKMLTMMTTMHTLQDLTRKTVETDLVELQYCNRDILSGVHDLSARVQHSLSTQYATVEAMEYMRRTADGFAKTLGQVSVDVARIKEKLANPQQTDVSSDQTLDFPVIVDRRNKMDVNESKNEDEIKDITAIRRRRLEHDIEVPDGVSLDYIKSEQDAFFDQMWKYDEHEVLGILQKYYEETKHRYNEFSSNGETALHIAATRGFLYVVDFIIEKKADLTIAATTGKRLVIERALEGKHDEVAELIADRLGKESVRELFQRRDLSTPPILNLMDYLDGSLPFFLNAVLDSMVDDREVFYRILECDYCGFEPSSLEFDKTKETVFQKIARLGNKNTVSQTAVRMLIDRKWQNFARGRFFFQMVMYLLSLFSLTMAAVLGIDADDVTKYSSHIDGVRTIFEVFVYAYTILITLPNEVVELKRKGRYYFRGFDLLEGLATILIISSLPVRYIDIRAHWYIFSIGYLTWTIVIFKYAAVFREYGAYAQVLWLIIKTDVVQFSVLFAVVNLAFSGTYFLALKADNNINMNNETSTYHGILFAGLQTITQGGPALSYADGYGFFSVAIQMAFLFVTLVILLNILIAQLSNTYTNIQGDAQRELLVRMARIIVSVEHGVWACSRQTDVKNFYVPSVSVRETSENQDQGTLRNIDFNLQYICDKQVTGQLKLQALQTETAKCSDDFDDMKKSIERGKVSGDAVKDKLDTVSGELGSVYETVGSFHSHVDKLHESLSALHEQMRTIQETLQETEKHIVPLT